jgi:hypothetical protein
VCAPPRGARVRKSPPIELRLQAVPGTLTCAREECPYCSLDGERAAEAIGRIGLRLVFRCTSCRTRFFRRHLPLMAADQGDELWDPLDTDLVEEAT